MNSDLKVQLLFATPVANTTIDFSICERYANVIKESFGEIETSGCTDDQLHKLPNFNELVTIIDNNVKTYTEEIVGIDKNDVTLSCMWSNSQIHLTKHHVHQHPNSFISGVLYLQIPECEDPGNIFFVDPRPAKNMFYADFKKETSLSDRNWWFKPVTGMLLLFPSWLEHGTHKYLCSTGERRISLSFNYILTRCSYSTMKI
jgi:uncharacterized protein (TIGR02466 family)